MRAAARQGVPCFEAVCAAGQADHPYEAALKRMQQAGKQHPSRAVWQLACSSQRQGRTVIKQGIPCFEAVYTARTVIKQSSSAKPWECSSDCRPRRTAHTCTSAIAAQARRCIGWVASQSGASAAASWGRAARAHLHGTHMWKVVLPQSLGGLPPNSNAGTSQNHSGGTTAAAGQGSCTVGSEQEAACSAPCRLHGVLHGARDAFLHYRWW